MCDEAHYCEELPGIESILSAQSGVKQLEDLRALKVKKIFGM